jgi:Mg-chelatase subunit ChlD
MFSPLDRRLRQLLEQGDVEGVLDIAEFSPARVGEALGEYGLALVNLVRQGDEQAEKLTILTWDQLDAATRELLMTWMIRLLVKIAREVETARGIRSGRPRPMPYRFDADELDIDATVERILAKPHVTYEDLIVLEREMRRRAFVLMLDCSGSMKGRKMAMAALAAASLALNIERSDEYGVVLFTEDTERAKGIRHSTPFRHVVRHILGIVPDGCTDVALGLQDGLRELRRSQAQDKTGILLSDGWKNMGGDPLTVARRFPTLHVIGLPGGDPAMCEEIAAAGKGRFVPVHDLADVPRALRVCLAH